MSYVRCQTCDICHPTKFYKINFYKKYFLSDTRCQVSDVTLTIWGPEVMDVKYWIPTIICCLINFRREISYIICRISVLCHLTNWLVICQACRCHMSDDKFRVSDVGDRVYVFDFRSWVRKFNYLMRTDMIWHPKN